MAGRWGTMGDGIGMHADGSGSQRDLISSVVQTVLVKLKVAYENVTEHLVGVDDHVDAITKLLDVGSDGIRYLQIHGIGGVGKTTLAQVIFNKLSYSFDRCCFLVDVRESSTGKNGSVNLQKKLLSNLHGPRYVDQIYQVNDGINMMSRVLKNKKVLIILDDVDEQEQLDSLAKDGNWFGSGSRIIITTRCNRVLVEGPNVSTYELCEMGFEHALKLFSRHAFRRDYPPNHASLSKEIVSTLGNLPLAIKITGSSLKGQSKAIWKDTFEKLKEAPPTEVQRKLMISYEKLEHTEKEIFLDIACFFVYKDKADPFYMWKDCKYHPDVAIAHLILMSLIKIKDDNTFWMHDQVRDLGREIVRQENSKHLGKRSRVWKREEALSILKWKEGSEKVEALSVGIRGSSGLHREILTRDEFANLQNLRFFEGVFVSLTGDFTNLLSKLRWFSWHLHGTKFETTNFHPANLVVLNLSRSCVSEEWIGWDQIREAKKLKVLDLSYCEYLKRTPDLSSWVYLEKLVLKGCSNLIEIDHSIGNLKELKVLKMSGIRDITKLPSAIGQVKKLKELDAQGCCNLIGEIPEKIGKLPRLRILNFSGTRISRLPTSMSHLFKLQTLELEKCPELKELPELPPSLTCLIWGPKSCWCSFKEMMRYETREYCDQEIGKQRQRLSTGNTCRQETLVSALPTSIGTLSQLKTLKLCCENVQFLPQLPSSLRELQLRDLITTQSSDFSNLKNLSNLTFYGCSLELTDLYGAESKELRMECCELRPLDAPLQLEMKRLRSLEMAYCEFHPKVLDLSRMKNLHKVSLLWCLSLVEICGFEESESLCSLSVVYCLSLERMSDLSKLKNLSELVVRSSRKLKRLQGLDHLESLKKCEISNIGEPNGDFMLELHFSFCEIYQKIYRWL
ncbi:hypothetical protein BT93_L3495 [Corymbia citriodora subsp. variegata]|uniref:NB-ARC domain-containing protein n=1 Tax=Corymbia citriodora subsp. variegata TaxID=360336 RepID=A0A8T0CY36_CORYI|nr:hypothetical protein BT93_L3495 [Corymbia citriodora subsp. variegata]